MGYKAPAIHRIGAYSVDCKCKKNQFAQFRDARVHCDECAGASGVTYHERIGTERIVYTKAPNA